jgi:hypothetical protein
MNKEQEEEVIQRLLELERSGYFLVDLKITRRYALALLEKDGEFWSSMDGMLCGPLPEDIAISRTLQSNCKW